MAGIYLHIPFCKSACSYCDFHFSTNLTRKQEMVTAICMELSQRKNELNTEEINSIYFGGGTPSLLDQRQLDQIFTEIFKHYTVSSNVEVTLEANPDDLSNRYLIELSKSPINRLSIGVQSFFEEDLKFMKRAHTADEALNCIQLAQQNGFKQLNIDLIYGYNALSLNNWEKSLQKVAELKIPHLSAYALTVETGTLIHQQIKKGIVKPIEEELAVTHFQHLMEWAKNIGWEQYEISNFCANQQYSRHNSAYWQRKKYLGVGPAAHSYKGTQRRWNVRNNAQYIKQIYAGEQFYEIENLSTNDRFNEYLLTSLRTIWGISKAVIVSEFGKKYWEIIDKPINGLISERVLVLNNGVFTLTEKGKLVADKIAADLFILNE